MARKKRSGRYGKVYSDLLTDPQLLRLMKGKGGKGAFAVHALALAWCAQHLTDGVIEAAVLPALYGRHADAQALVDAGFWTVHGEGWRIDGYDKANLTRRDVDALKLGGQIDRCKGWMSKGKTCSCGHHTPTGDLIGDPIGDLVGALSTEGVNGA